MKSFLFVDPKIAQQVKRYLDMIGLSDITVDHDLKKMYDGTYDLTDFGVFILHLGDAGLNMDQLDTLQAKITSAIPIAVISRQDYSLQITGSSVGFVQIGPLFDGFARNLTTQLQRLGVIR